MCRLALFNKQWVIEHTEKEVEDLFARLNNLQGGHGMGVYLYGKKSILLKARDITATKLAKLVYKNINNLQYGMFHCRLAGPAGSICNENCQPYVDEDYKISLAHNGVAREFCDSKYDYSDTELLLKMLCDYGIPIKNLQYYSGVFIGINSGVPFVIKGNAWTDLELAVNHDTGGWLFCSQVLYPFTKQPYVTVKIREIVWQGHDVSKLYDTAIAEEILERKHSNGKYYTGGWSYDEDGYCHGNYKYTANNFKTTTQPLANTNTGLIKQDALPDVTPYNTQYHIKLNLLTEKELVEILGTPDRVAKAKKLRELDSFKLADIHDDELEEFIEIEQLLIDYIDTRK